MAFLPLLSVGNFSSFNTSFGLESVLAAVVFEFLLAAGLEAVLVGLAVFELSFEVVNDAVQPAKDIPSAEIIIIKKSLFFIFSPVSFFYLETKNLPAKYAKDAKKG